MEILAEGQLVDDLAAVGAFLPEPLGHIALFVAGPEGGFFEEDMASEASPQSKLEVRSKK